jgi:hypothetical protein
MALRRAESVATDDVPTILESRPRAALLTMRTVRMLNSGELDSVLVLRPQDYADAVTLSRRTAAQLRAFYPDGRRGAARGVNERTGIAKGQGVAVTGTGADRWWVANDELVFWLEERARWFHERRSRMKK